MISINSLHKQLENIYLTFIKNKQRIYSIENNQKKLNNIKQIKTQFFQLLQQNSNDDSIVGKIENFNTLYYNTKRLILAQLNMSNMDVKTASALSPLVNIEETSIRDFINEIEAYHDLLNDAGKTALIKYVVKAKIKNLAQTRIADITIANFDQLVSALYTRVRAAETSESLQLKLFQAKQGRKSIAEFASDLEQIAQKLSEINIKDQNINDANGRKIVKDTINNIVLNQFKIGVHDELKQVVNASRPKTLAEALAVASASNLDNQSIFFVNKTNNYQKSGKFKKKSDNPQGKKNYEKQGNKNNNSQNPRKKYDKKQEKKVFTVDCEHCNQTSDSEEIKN